MASHGSDFHVKCLCEEDAKCRVHGSHAERVDRWRAIAGLKKEGDADRGVLQRAFELSLTKKTSGGFWRRRGSTDWSVDVSG